MDTVNDPRDPDVARLQATRGTLRRVDTSNRTRRNVPSDFQYEIATKELRRTPSPPTSPTGERSQSPVPFGGKSRRRRVAKKKVRKTRRRGSTRR